MNAVLYEPMVSTRMSRTFAAHFRCRPQLAASFLTREGEYSLRADEAGNGHPQSRRAIQHRLQAALQNARVERESLHLPFDFDELIHDLRLERYIRPEEQRPFGGGGFAHTLYYAIRPLLRTPIRRKLQSLWFRSWQSAEFPGWPLDTSVERMFSGVMTRLLEAGGGREEPFIWFWPCGASSALIMTHDVETEAGLKFLPTLMDIDEEFRVPAAFQLVPEDRYVLPDGLRQSIVDRGFEVGVQDLNHDGHLFDNEAVFQERVARINRYGRTWGALGFRAGALYRNHAWSKALEFEYDMSVPTVGHLEAQRGGCCTVFPYFSGDLLELPLTTTQDYTLFHILRQYSTSLWRQQIELILEQSGLISFIVHPDYIAAARERQVYRDLLAIVAELRDSSSVWAARPCEVNRWWRDRAQSELKYENGAWTICGPASKRAVVAYARLEEDRLVYRLEGAAAASCKTDASLP